MITKDDFFGFPYFEYGEAFFGSSGSYRYRMAREPLANVHFTPPDKRGEASLRAIWWKGIYSYAATDPEEMHIKDFPFTEEGMTEAIEWLSSECTEDTEETQAE